MMEPSQKDSKLDAEKPDFSALHILLPSTKLDQSFKEYFRFFSSINTDQHLSTSPFQNLDKPQSVNSSYHSVQSKVNQKIIQLAQSCALELYQNQFSIATTSINDLQNDQLPSAPFEIHVVRSLVTWEIVQIYCRLGRIFKKFIVLNSSQTFQSNNRMYRDEKSSFGTIQNKIFYLNWLEEPYALKRIRFSKSQLYTKSKDRKQFYIHNIPSFSRVVQEYFIANIMSALKIGPQIKKVNGFDFIVHDAFIEFHMQLCQSLHTTDFECEMKVNLLKMHCLRICHMDIAPKNIMFSPKFKKSVFIDFGISSMLKQRIDKATYTCFRGTYEYSSPNMQNLLKNDSKGYVNLYLNDVHGLQKSLIEIKQKKMADVSKKIKKQEKNVSLTLLGTYKQVWNKVFSILDENIIKSDESVFKRLSMEKNYHKLLLIRTCKFILYCLKIYFQALPIHHLFDAKELHKLYKFNDSKLIQMILHLNEQLRVFSKIFDPFIERYQTQTLTAYKQFYTQSEQVDSIIDISQEIRKWQSFYRLISLYKRQKPKLPNQIPFDSLREIIMISCDKNLLQQYVSNKINIQRYIGFLLMMANFSSSITFVTSQLRKTVFKIYSDFRKQILQQIFPKTLIVRVNSAIYPSSLYSQYHSSQVLQFYDDMLRVILESSQNYFEQQDRFELKSLIFRHGFQILKNLIFLGFNCFQFIRQYLKNCLLFFIKTQDLKEHLIIIMIRQTIEIGLFFKHCQLVVQNGQNFSNTSKHRLLNQEILKLDKIQQAKYFITKDPILCGKIRIIEKMWIFLNPEYAKLMLSYQHLLAYFKSVEKILIDEFVSVNLNQMGQAATVYEETLQNLKTYTALCYLDLSKEIRPQSQNVLNTNNPYNRIFLGKYGLILLQMIKQRERKIDINFFMTIEIPLNDKKRICLLQSKIQQIKQISKTQNMNIFLFFQEQLEYSLGCKNRNIMQILIRHLTSQKYDKFSLIHVVNKTACTMRKIISYPDKFYKFDMFPKLWQVMIRSIETLNQQLYYWKDKRIKAYEIEYIKMVQFTVDLLHEFQQFRIYENSKENPVELTLDINQNYFSMKQLLQQFSKTLESNQKNLQQNDRINLFKKFIQNDLNSWIYMDLIELSIEKFQEYVQSLNEIFQLIIKIYLSGQHLINLASLKNGYFQYWFLIIQSIVFQSHRAFLSARILKSIFSLSSSAYKFFNMSQFQMNQIVKKYNQFNQFFYQESETAEVLDNLIHSFALAYFYDIHHHQGRNILSLQSQQDAILQAILAFRGISKTLSPSIINYLIKQIIQSKQLPAQYVYSIYLQLFQDHRQYFETKEIDKQKLITKLFLKFQKEDLGKLKDQIFCQLYFQYLNSIMNLQLRLNQTNSKFKGKIKSERKYPPIKIIRKIIRYYTTKSQFNTTSINQYIKSFINDEKIQIPIINFKLKDQLKHRLKKKRLIYFGLQCIEFEGYIQQRDKVINMNQKQLKNKISLVINSSKNNLELPRPSINNLQMVQKIITDQRLKIKSGYKVNSGAQQQQDIAYLPKSSEKSESYEFAIRKFFQLKYKLNQKIESELSQYKNSQSETNLKIIKLRKLMIEYLFSNYQL